MAICHHWTELGGVAQGLICQLLHEDILKAVGKTAKGTSMKASMLVQDNIAANIKVYKTLLTVTESKAKAAQVPTTLLRLSQVGNEVCLALLI